MDAHAQHSAQDAAEAARKAQVARAGNAAAAAPDPSPIEAASRQAAGTVRQTTETARRSVRRQAPVVAAGARGVGEGARRFGKAMWGPFAHMSSVLWSEVTGAFFGLFAFYFAQGIFKYHQQYRAGPDHQRFVLDIVLTSVFGYFAASSFYIARRKEKRKRG